MYNMRESWTDARLDEFAANVDRRFGEMDRRLDKIDKRLDRIEQQFEQGFARLDSKLDAMQRAMFHGAIALTGGMLAGFGGILVLIATQL